MKFLFLDVYKKSHCRISKDTAGGYGTENDLGDGIFGKTLSRLVKSSIFWPNLSFIQLMEEFEDNGHDCIYRKQVGSRIPAVDKFDAIFVCSSIVCFELEIDACKNISKQSSSPIFLCGSVGQFIKEKIPEEVTVLTGNYEFLSQQLNNTNSNIYDLKKGGIINIKNGDANNLKLINWARKSLSGNKNLLLGNRKFFFPYISTRGCPYSCREYCTYPTSQGRKVLQESVDVIVDKLKQISTNYPKSHIVFRDPVFSINLKHTKALLKKIGDEDLPIEFSAELHLSNVDDELLDLCNHANFVGLKFGIESVHKEIRDSVNRFSIENDDQMKIIAKINQAKIKTVGMFILAQPDDTYETCMQTIDYARNLNLNIAQFSIFTPYPGTPFYESGRVKTQSREFQDFNQYNLVYEHSSISNKVARSLLETAYKKFLLSKAKNLFAG